MQTIDTFDSGVPVRLKELRVRLGLKQQEISAKIGIDRSYWSALERGKRELTGKIFKELFVTFNISADWLISGYGSMFSRAQKDEPIIELQKSLRDYHSELDRIYKNIYCVLELRIKFLNEDLDCIKYMDELHAVVNEYGESSKSSTDIMKQLALHKKFDEVRRKFILDFTELFENFYFDAMRSGGALKRKFIAPKNVTEIL